MKLWARSRAPISRWARARSANCAYSTTSRQYELVDTPEALERLTQHVQGTPPSPLTQCDLLLFCRLQARGNRHRIHIVPQASSDAPAVPIGYGRGRQHPPLSPPMSLPSCLSKHNLMSCEQPPMWRGHDLPSLALHRPSL